MRRSLAALLLLVALALGPLAASAQSIDDTTYNEWTAMVERVDRVLDADRANEETLNRLRAEVAKFRDQFLAAENANADKVQRAQRQLDTLGPAPAEGQTEPEEVASRRNALNQEIASLKAPAVRATEAFVQADAMVSEIDKALRARQADKVLQRYPVPFNPLNWTATLAELRDAILRVPHEAAANLQRLAPQADWHAATAAAPHARIVATLQRIGFGQVHFAPVETAALVALVDQLLAAQRSA